MTGFLITRIHEQKHAKEPCPECLLCVEAKAKAEKARPAWLANLGAKDMTRGLA